MKKNLKNIFIIFLVVVLIIESIVLGLTLIRLKYWEDVRIEKLNHIRDFDINEDETDMDRILGVEKINKDVSQVEVHGWIPDWDYSDGFDSFRDQSESFSSISPFWFDLEADGSLERLRGVNDIEIINYTRENNIDLIPSITCFEVEKLSEVLNSEENLSRHIDEIISQVVDNDYDGIDIDYESIYLRDNEKFFEFIQRLSARLVENNKKLSITVLSKWGDRDVIYSAFPETRKNFDYYKLAQFADQFRIMTYEYTPKTSQYYGPIAPIGWVEDVIRYTISVGVPRDKIIMGVHLYSYDFSDRPKLPEINHYPTLFIPSDSTKPAALAYYNNIVEDLIEEDNMIVNYEEEWGEAIGTYIYEGQRRYVVFPNQRTIDDRKRLAADYGIKGVAYWRIGDQGSLKY